MAGANVKNLIFDIGGVIIDLSVERTVGAFANLTGRTPEHILQAYKTSLLFTDFEKGLISSDGFRSGLKEMFSVKAADEVLDDCWNAMLVNLPKDKLDLLIRLQENYRVFLLSNTNHIHLEYVNRRMVDPIAGGKTLDDFFHVSYYSHLVGMRKPEPEIFNKVLKDNELSSEETLFLDDTLPNIEGAASVGIQTRQINHPDELYSIFQNYVSKS